MLRTTIMAAIAFLSLGATSAAALTAQQQSVSYRWVPYTMPLNGEGILEHVCADRFANALDCYDAFVAVNAETLRQHRCGPVGWLCAGVTYLIPSATYATQAVSWDNPAMAADELRQYAMDRFDIIDGHIVELQSQDDALAAAVEVLDGRVGAVESTVQTLQSNIDDVESQASNERAALASLVEESTSQLSEVSGRVSNNERRIAALEQLSPTDDNSGTAGNSQPDPGDTSSEKEPKEEDTQPPPGDNANWWSDVFWPWLEDWLIVLLIIAALLGLWWFNNRKKDDPQTDAQSTTSTSQQDRSITFPIDWSLPQVYNRPQSVVVRKPDGSLAQVEVTHRQKKGVSNLYSWSLSWLPPADTTYDGTKFTVKGKDQLERFLQQAYQKGELENRT